MSHIISGKNPVIEALLAGRPINKIFVASNIKSGLDAKLVQLARRQGIPVREVDRKKLQELAGHENTQGVVAVLLEYGYSSEETIFERAAQRQELPLIAVLDEIQDPHNLGAIIRSAEAFGFHGVVIPKDRSAGLSDTVAKTSAGAVAHLPIVRVTNLAQWLENIKSQQIWVAGADQQAEVSLFHADLNRALAVVIGSEGKGLRRLVRERCDFLVRIPMAGQINSLNASVAAALIFCEARKQRGSNP
ncbi:MAG: 23S rRNA (guanosine(2251)-2'-O)-methyltransferase RlmB [candidate division KSB1 bacterium]|nr:23S rRNA (guanosine(2251)-2'-O)-methyltransferase RlmB [candidate division KSB1 bacterium]MDZ7333967.1 23S rRNA (guanosine(2251)-2'-O)-methyltransferase RlmB [candidate division KSB1 bacterium]MDZ7356763.1 23S rRNA (guanosine(2251)-2'-O)-methyltransferase RlmB [candidate division KSB1 bacterium]MDZ7376606.1 23S rRNA (guanosine(2251)-2'-O)-methyltransferase RlmB [candidate division KSB1 bacterium]MDZ7399952.1 23S rRNA (guanosine(2251)-2'-O)-methyltransferase RlmB [candidate division KSB1 bact